MSARSPIQVSGLSHSFGKGALQKQVLFDITTEIPGLWRDRRDKPVIK